MEKIRKTDSLRGWSIWKKKLKTWGTLLLAVCVLAASYPGEVQAFAAPETVSDGDAASAGAKVQEGAIISDVPVDFGDSAVSDGNAIGKGSAVSGGNGADAGRNVSSGDTVSGGDSLEELTKELPPLPEGAVLFAREGDSDSFAATGAALSGIHIRVSYKAGVFPEQAALLVKEITDGSALGRMKESLSAVTPESSGAELICFRISVLVLADGQWQEAQPDLSAGYPQVAMKGEKLSRTVGDGGQSLQLYRMEESLQRTRAAAGMAARELPVTVSGGAEVSFAAPYFSSYAMRILQEAVKITADFAGGNSADKFVLDESGTKGKYNLTLQIKASELTDPTLSITVPKGINLIYYPDHTNTTIGPYLRNGSDSVRKSTDGDGNTVLTYDLKSQTAELGFNITLFPTYKLKDGAEYAVTARVTSSEGEAGSAAHSILVENPSVKPNTVSLYKGNDQKILYNDSPYYEVKCDIATYFQYYRHYPFQEFTAVLPVLEGVACGYYEDGVFQELAKGAVRNIVLDGVDCGSVTLYASWKEYDPSSGYECPVLVYRLNAEHPVSKGEGSSYIYPYQEQLGGIYYRFSAGQVAEKLQAADTYTYETAVKGEISALIDGVKVPLRAVSSGANISVQFRRFKISDYFYLNGYSSYDSIYVGSNVLNLEDNTCYDSRIMNTTGETLTDVKVEYTVDSALYASRLAVTFAQGLSSKYPNTASIRYKTSRGGDTVYTASLNRDNPELRAPEGDAIVWAEAVYDKIGSDNNVFSVLKLYLVNREEKSSGTGAVKGRILSAKAPVSLVGGDGLVPEQSEETQTFFFANFYEVYTSGSLSKSMLNKGDEFSVNFYTRQNYKVIVDHPVYYILMPAEYIYNGYTPPSDLKDIPYTVNSRRLTVNAAQQEAIGKDSSGKYYAPEGEYILYTVAYEGTGLVTSGSHTMKFAVGPQVDTSEYREKVYLPALYMLEQQNTMFPFKTTGSYQRVDVLDFDGDGDTSESMAGGSSRTSASLNAAKALTVQAYLSSDFGGGGEALEQQYQYCSEGAWDYYIYNGLDSSSIASNAEIIVTLPREGRSVTFSGKTYRSEWAALLTGAPSCSGPLLEEAEVAYSADGGSSYTYNPLTESGGYGAVTHVKICSAAGKELKQNEMGVISLPLTAGFGENVTSSAKKAYLSASASYDLTGTSGRNMAEVQPCIMTPVPVAVSGVVFKDYNGNLSQEEEEKANGKNYPVKLYKGEYTSGTAGLTQVASTSTNMNTGSFSMNSGVYGPGEYVLRVEKGSGEYFAEVSGWYSENNNAYYPFTVSGTVKEINVLLPMVSPRTVNVTGFTSGSYLYENGNRKINVSVNPALGAGESVTFTSSDSAVVSVAADGSLQYVGDGNAVVTVSVPQLSALVGTFGPEPVTQEIKVYARKPLYGLTLHTGAGILTAEGYTQEAEGVYKKEYEPGNYISLPTESAFTKPGETWYLEGWYTEENGAGTKVSSISSTDYGDRTLYANWQLYETKYETAAGVWAYGTFSNAISKVYDGGVVALLRDVSYTTSLSIYRPVILKTDGQPRKLDMKSYSLYVDTNGTLTVDDKLLNVTGSNSSGTVYVYDQTAKVVVKNGVVSNTGTGSAIYDHDYYSGTVSISGGTVRGGTYGVSVKGNLELSGAASIEGTDADIYLRSGARIKVLSELSNTEAYRLGASSYSAGKVLGEAASAEAYAEFTCVNDRYHVGYGSGGSLLLQEKVTVTPDANQQKTYGEKDPDFTYAASSRSPVLTGKPGRETGESAGSYAYTLGTLSGGDSYYLVLNGESPKFTIAPKEVDVPAIPEKVYNGTVQMHGLAETEQYRVTISKDDTESASAAGSYSVTVQLKDTDNYVWNDGTVEQKTIAWIIKEAVLTVNAAGYAGIYDSKEHGITVTVDPSGAKVYYALSPLNQDNYLTLGSLTPILRSGAQEEETIYYYITADNYQPDSGSAGISISPRPITVKPGDETRKAGEANPTFSLELTAGSQLAGEEVLSGETVGTPDFACEADADSPEGSYPVKIVSLTGGSGNYEITYSGEASTGVLTVTQEAVENGDYRIEPEGYVPGSWSRETIVIKPVGDYTQIRQVFKDGSPKGNWESELTLQDWTGEVFFELRTETGAVTKTFDVDMVLQSDTQPPRIGSGSESINEADGVITEEIFLSDNLSDVDPEALSLTLDGEPVPFQLKEEENGYRLVFERTSEQAYVLSVSDKAGNTEERLLELQTSLYETVYAAGEGALGTLPSVKFWEHARFVLPENPFTKAGFAFCGWEYGGRLYQPGSAFRMPAENMVFTAKWARNEVQAQVSGHISYENGQNVPGAAVEFFTEDTLAGSAVTGENGGFTLGGIPNAVYTVKAVMTDSKGEAQTVTQKVSIVDGVVTVNGEALDGIRLIIPQPDSVKVLEQRINALIPDTAGGQMEELQDILESYENLAEEKKQQFFPETLEKLDNLIKLYGRLTIHFENEGSGVAAPGYDSGLGLLVTAQDLQRKDKEGVDISIIMEICRVSEQEAEAGQVQDLLLIREKAGDRTVSDFYEVTITKRVGEEVTAITELREEIELVFEIPPTMQGGSDYCVLRNHEGNVTALPTVQEGNKLRTASRLYSTYAIAYIPAAASQGGAAENSGMAENSGTAETAGKAGERKLDDVPKTGHDTDRTAGDPSGGVTMWLETGDEKKCRKKEEAAG